MQDNEALVTIVVFMAAICAAFYAGSLNVRRRLLAFCAENKVADPRTTAEERYNAALDAVAGSVVQWSVEFKVRPEGEI